jgi:hypothetical protein
VRDSRCNIVGGGVSGHLFEHVSICLWAYRPLPVLHPHLMEV